MWDSVPRQRYCGIAESGGSDRSVLAREIWERPTTTASTTPALEAQVLKQRSTSVLSAVGKGAKEDFVLPLYVCECCTVTVLW